MNKAVIAEVYPNSLAEEIGLKKGDKILKINNQELNDLIDFQFNWAEEEIELLVESHNGEQILFEIEKDYDEPLGVVFENAVFDKMHTCHNNCVFCFVAQMAPNMRKSLYQKDDDYRLSFLQGNFISLTNIKDSEMGRIKKYNLSPLYVSVHTTNKELRKKMLNNSNAGKILNQLQELTAAGIEINTQIVLCPGINDGEYLEKTIEDLSNLWPGVRSIAVVPVGVTKYRKNLELFPEISQEYALEIIKNIEEKQKFFKNKYGYSLVFLSDEFYVKGQKTFPSKNIYEDFPQTENGIGISRIFLDDFNELLPNLPTKVSHKKLILVTGVSGEYVLTPIVSRLNAITGLQVKLLPIKNNFFGQRVTVTGLITGGDLKNNLMNLSSDYKVIIPDVMLKKDENIFLDGITLEQLSKELAHLDLHVIETSAQALIKEIFNE